MTLQIVGVSNWASFLSVSEVMGMCNKCFLSNVTR
jgi:hypothetical protein